jgi:hypothetical protein
MNISLGASVGADQRRINFGVALLLLFTANVWGWLWIIKIVCLQAGTNKCANLAIFLCYTLCPLLFIKKYFLNFLCVFLQLSGFDLSPLRIRSIFIIRYYSHSNPNPTIIRFDFNSSKNMTRNMEVAISDLIPSHP